MWWCVQGALLHTLKNNMAQELKQVQASRKAYEKCRLAILLFTATAFNELPSSISSADGTVAQMMQLLNDRDICSYLTPDFQLWASCLAATCTSPKNHQTYHDPLLGLISKMKISIEEQLDALLSSFFRNEDSLQTQHRVLSNIFKQESQGFNKNSVRGSTISNNPSTAP